MRRSRLLNAVLVTIVSLTLSLGWVSFALAWDDDGGDCCDVVAADPPSPPDPPEAYSPPDPPYIEPVYSPPDPPAPDPVYAPAEQVGAAAAASAYAPPDSPVVESTPPAQTNGSQLPYDYYELTLSALFFNVSYTVDRYGNVYQGVGGGVQTPAPGATLFGGVILSEPSTPQNVSNFIQNWTVTTGGAFGYGDAVTYSGFSGVPYIDGGPTQIAFLQGVGTPGAFATATNSQQTTYGNLIAQGLGGLQGGNPLQMIVAVGMIGLSLYLRSSAP